MKVSFSLAPEVLRALDRERDRVGMSRSAYVEQILLIAGPATSDRMLRVAGSAKARAAQPKGRCSHGKDMLTVLPYLTRCDPAKGGCGVKVR